MDLVEDPIPALYGFVNDLLSSDPLSLPKHLLSSSFLTRQRYLYKPDVGEEELLQSTTNTAERQRVEITRQYLSEASPDEWVINERPLWRIELDDEQEEQDGDGDGKDLKIIFAKINILKPTGQNLSTSIVNYHNIDMSKGIDVVLVWELNPIQRKTDWRFVEIVDPTSPSSNKNWYPSFQIALEEFTKFKLRLEQEQQTNNSNNNEQDDANEFWAGWSDDENDEQEKKPTTTTTTTTTTKQNEKYTANDIEMDSQIALKQALSGIYTMFKSSYPSNQDASKAFLDMAKAAVDNNN